MMLALIAALIVSAYNRSWLARPVCELAAGSDLSMERLSRLKGRLLVPMEALIERATQRGRPRVEATDMGNASARGREEILSALLAVAASLIRHVPLRRRHLQDRLVSAFERLRIQHSISLKSFCQTLGLSERTFRVWRRRPAPTPQPEQTGYGSLEKNKERHRLGDGRFDLVHLVPGIQTMADTTDLKVLGIPLKLIALQDPGRRLKRIFEGVSTYTQEKGQEVADLISRVLSKVPGAQLITDQGKPYLSELARQAYERLEIDHAPQKEGVPTDKAPLERAFGIIKDALSPLLELTNHLAGILPALKDPHLAKPLADLLVAVFLRVYLMAARDCTHPLEKACAQEIDIIAQQQREKARQEERSKRLLLGQIHEAYSMEGSREGFIRAHRHHALEDIRKAEVILREKACRCQTLACDRYFAGILRNVAEEGRVRRARIRDERLKMAREKAQWEEERGKRDFLRKHPELLLKEGLDLLSAQWDERGKYLIANGAGPGRMMVREAAEILSQKNPWTYQDDIQAILNNWAEDHKEIDPQGVTTIERLVHRVVEEQAERYLTPSREDYIRAITRGYEQASPAYP